MNTFSSPSGQHTDRVDPGTRSWDAHQAPGIHDIASPPRAQLRGHNDLANEIRNQQQQPNWDQRHDMPPQPHRQSRRGDDDDLPYSGDGDNAEDPQEESYHAPGRRNERQDSVERSRGKRHGKGKRRADW